MWVLGVIGLSGVAVADEHRTAQLFGQRIGDARARHIPGGGAAQRVVDPGRAHEPLGLLKAARADIPIAIPIGSTEQHGHHLPVCTDWVIPERLLEAASRECDLIVGQFVPFGYRRRPRSGGGQHFPGTLSLRATTFIALLEDILSELKRCGFRNIVLYNWHYENSGFIYEPAFLVLEDANPDFTPDRQQAIWPEGFPGLALEHAAVIETSLLLYHAPHLVREDRIAADAPERVVNHDVLPIDTRMSTASGVLSSPEAASAEKGRMLTEWMVQRLVGILDEELADRRGGTSPV